MQKISFEAFEKMMLYDVVKNHACIEVEFSVDGDPAYDGCYLGKTVDKATHQCAYWYGLAEDGSQAYDYDNPEAFVNAKVFHGRSIKQLWSRISIFSIDACPVEERLPFFLGLADGPRFGPAS